MSIIDILILLSRIHANHGRQGLLKPFWQEPWKKHRRRAWKRQRSAGRG